MTYIFHDKKLENNKKYLISQSDCPHLFSFKPVINDIFFFTDFKGNYSKTKILEFNKKNKEIEILVLESHFRSEKEFLEDFDESFSIALACPDKIYLEKFIELVVLFPVINIHLFFSQRSLRYAINLDRINNIMIRSASQCQRVYLPKIIINHDENFEGYEKKILFDTQSEIKYDQAFKKTNKSNNKLYIMGPEGGFTKTEIEEFKSNDVIIVSKNGLIMPSWASVLLI